MSRSEFCVQVAPAVLELENECRKMPIEEFICFRKEVMEEVSKTELNEKFMTSVFDLIQKRVFGENPVSKTA